MAKNYLPGSTGQSWRHTLAPFIWDSRIGAPTSEVVAAKSLDADPERASKLKGKVQP